MKAITADGEIARLRSKNAALRAEVAALRWQVEHEGCAASHIGETTYECHADAPCGLCRLRGERDQAQVAVRSLLAQMKEDDRCAREAGLTHDNIREALSAYAADDISFGRLVEIVRASARVMAGGKS